MKRFQPLIFGLAILLTFSLVPLFAQGGGGHMGGNGHFNPDSLSLVTVTGTAMVDSSVMRAMYFLDEDGDGNADYILNFGPYWYQPDSSTATRPANGDNITIYGGLHDSTYNATGLSVIVVYEINGQFWRDPYTPFWGNNGGHGHGGGMHHGSHMFGWMHDTLQTVSLSGVTLVDTTFIFEMYFLDADQDGLPDYFLNFGPPWYEPESGISRPADGDTISIVGGELNTPAMPVVVVYELNGQTWRDSSAIGPHFGGQWIHRNMTQNRFIHTPWDSLSGMTVQSGWHMGGGHGGGMLPDSLFCQMLQVFPQTLPNVPQHTFLGYEVGAFTRSGFNMMGGGNGWMGGNMMFSNQVNFQLHYNDILLQGNGIDENTIQALSWDTQTQTWVPVAGASVDPSTNTVTFTNPELSSYVILTGESTALSIDDGSSLVASDFSLDQNYPNPFNPSTSIRFTLKNAGNVALSVYNVLGQKVTDLVNKYMEAGSHSVQFDATSLPSGIYFYELNVNGHSLVRKMNLMK